VRKLFLLFLMLTLAYAAGVSVMVMRQDMPTDTETVRELSPAERRRTVETLAEPPPETSSGVSRWSIAIIRCRKRYSDRRYCENQVYVHGRTRF